MQRATDRCQSPAFTPKTESFLVLIVVPQRFAPAPTGGLQIPEATMCLSPCLRVLGSHTDFGNGGLEQEAICGPHRNQGQHPNNVPGTLYMTDSP